jgi:hypothetical protein
MIFLIIERSPASKQIVFSERRLCRRRTYRLLCLAAASAAGLPARPLNSEHDTVQRQTDRQTSSQKREDSYILSRPVKGFTSAVLSLAIPYLNSSIKGKDEATRYLGGCM